MKFSHPTLIERLQALGNPHIKNEVKDNELLPHTKNEATEISIHKQALEYKSLVEED